MPNQTNNANTTNPAILTATIEYYPLNGPVITKQVTRKPGEKTFVNEVGRFIHQNKLSSNHLNEKWYPKTQKIQIFETNDAPHTEGDCF